MIVKVQRSLNTKPGNHEVMAYNEDKSVFIQVPASKELLKIFGKREKFYCNAEIVNKQLDLREEVPEQDW